MKTAFVTPEKYAKEALRLSKEVDATGGKKLKSFAKVMRENRGSLARFNYYGETGDGMERKNPLIVALGDSVTAGHFEFAGNFIENFKKVDEGTLTADDYIEITDARVCYLEQFRGKLIDKFEQTSVSTINSGIAGDVLWGMQKRLYRDVIRYQPDLILLNGCLNWPAECGGNQEYEKVLKEIVTCMKTETQAEIVLMTPNMDYVPEEMKAFSNPNSTVADRVDIIRRVAHEMDVFLADTYKVWEAYVAQGNPLLELLANGSNHPSVTGHEMYANVLMQLFD